MKTDNTEILSAREVADPEGVLPAQNKTKLPKKHPLGYVAWGRDFKQNGVAYLLFLIPAAFLFVFYIAPMFWLLMSFEDFKFNKGIFGSEWVWFDNFIRLFEDAQFWLAFRNTIAMAVINLVFGFVFPLALALLLSQVRIHWFKRFTQTVAFLPYFISTVVICMMARFFLDENGAITEFLSLFGAEKQNWLSNGDIPVFWFINGFIESWQKAGYNSIMFIAVIASVDGAVHEAAAMDGANRWQQVWLITVPSIMPFVLMMLTVNVGMIFMQGFDKILLLYNPDNMETADALTTYIYRKAFTSGSDYALSTAAGLFQSVIATILMLFSNWLNRRTGRASLM